jgi:hypothetical protein
MGLISDYVARALRQAVENTFVEEWPGGGERLHAADLLESFLQVLPIHNREHLDCCF